MEHTPPQRYSLLNARTRKALREQYIINQDGNCYHCGKPLSKPPEPPVAMKPINERLFPKNFFMWPIHLHHSHKTGMTIGAVHARCNAVLWQYHGE